MAGPSRHHMASGVWPVSLRAMCPAHGRYDSNCPDCPGYARNYRQRRKRGLRDGTWDRVLRGEELATVRQAVQGLLDHPGVSVPRIATAAGVVHATVYRLLSGVTEHLRADIGRTLLDLTPESCLKWAPLGPGVLVDSIGTARRLQALSADRWSSADLRDVCGVAAADLSNWRRRMRPTLTRGTHDMIADLYEKIQGLPDPLGPSPGAARQARRLGYLPPFRWDGSTIDDPAATPLPLLSDADDWVHVQRVVEAALRKPERGCASGLPREAQRELARRALLLGWSWQEIGAVIGKSQSAAEYLVVGRVDRPHTRAQRPQGPGVLRAGERLRDRHV